MESESVGNPPPVTGDEQNQRLDSLETQSSIKTKEIEMKKKPTEENKQPRQFDFYNANYDKYMEIVEGSDVLFLP